jgi:hypothetical protein
MTALFSGASGAGGRDPLALLAMRRRLRPLLAPGLLERAMHSAELTAAGVVALAGAAPTPLFCLLAQDHGAGTVVEFADAPEVLGAGGDAAGNADDIELRCILEEAIPARIVGNAARAVVLVLPADLLGTGEHAPLGTHDEDSDVEFVHLLGVDANGRASARSGFVERDSSHMAVTCDFRGGPYTGPELASAQAAWREALNWTLLTRGPN